MYGLGQNLWSLVQFLISDSFDDIGLMSIHCKETSMSAFMKAWKKVGPALRSCTSLIPDLFHVSSNNDYNQSITSDLGYSLFSISDGLQYPCYLLFFEMSCLVTNPILPKNIQILSMGLVVLHATCLASCSAESHALHGLA